MDRKKVFAESLAPKKPNAKKVAESKAINEGMYKKYLILNTHSDAYEPSDIRSTMTVGQLIEELKTHDMNMPVLYGNNEAAHGWKSYGKLRLSDVDEYESEDEEDEEVYESKDRGHAKFKPNKCPFKKK